MLFPIWFPFKALRLPLCYLYTYIHIVYVLSNLAAYLYQNPSFKSFFFEDPAWPSRKPPLVARLIKGTEISHYTLYAGLHLTMCNRNINIALEVCTALDGRWELLKLFALCSFKI